jgi:hypothetical protein
VTRRWAAPLVAALVALAIGGGSRLRREGPEPAPRPIVQAPPAAVAPVTAAAAAAPSTSQPAPAITANSELEWGAYAGGGQYGRADAPWDMRTLDTFEAHAGRKVSLLEWGQAWMECDPSCHMSAFNPQLLDAVRARGATPIISWGSYRQGAGVSQPSFRLASITSGTYDNFIVAWASAAKAWGHPLLLRFDWEMNTKSVPYSEAANGNRAGEFVAMWRHVRGIFRQVGVTNVAWVWCPNVAYPGSLPIDPLYPGNDQVDWVGLDGYNWGTNPHRPGSKWSSFHDVFSSTYGHVAGLAPDKPFLIAETASTEYGGSKASWITDAFARLRQDFPRVRGIVWFNKSADGMDWVIESSASAQKAFATAIGSHP